MGIKSVLKIVKQGHLFPKTKFNLLNSNIAIKEVSCKTIISKSSLYGLDYTINPFSGCIHNCIYCYVPAMRKRWGEKRKWGSYIDIKANSIEILRKQQKKIKNGSILISSVTDPYQIIEKDYCLTRRILSLLSGKNPLQVFILTKSDLVLRDIDIIEKNSHWQVGMTLTTLDDNIRKITEPNASKIQKRLEALRELSERGITTYVFLGPIIPFFGADSLIEMLDALESINLSYIMVDRINRRGENIKRLIQLIRQINPGKQMEKEFIQATKENSPYFRDVKIQLTEECKKRKIPLTFNY